MSSIRWDDGFRRLMLVLTVAWMGFYAWAESPQNNLREWSKYQRAVSNVEAVLAQEGTTLAAPNGPTQRWEAEAARTELLAERDRQWDHLTGHWSIMFYPPFAMFCLYLLLGWIIKGFRRSSRP